MEHIWRLTEKKQNKRAQESTSTHPAPILIKTLGINRKLWLTHTRSGIGYVKRLLCFAQQYSHTWRIEAPLEWGIINYNLAFTINFFLHEIQVLDFIMLHNLISEKRWHSFGTALWHFKIADLRCPKEINHTFVNFRTLLS